MSANERVTPLAPAQRHDDASTRVAERVYSLLLNVYPSEFRHVYGREMLLLFRDQWRDQHASPCHTLGASVRFWAAILLDVGRSAPPLGFEALRTRLQAEDERSCNEFQHIHPEDRIMTTKQIVATLAVLGGVFEMLSTASEASDGWSMNHGNGWVLAIALGVLMGALLLASGVALLRSGAAAIRLAQGAALACLALVVGLHFVFPYMSIFSVLVGIAIPIALLVMTSRSSGDRSRPSVA